MKNNISRLILKKGQKYVPFAIEDIAMFYTESRVIFAVDRSNNKYICDRNLLSLQSQLDSNLFFRANRQYIININFITSYQPYARVRIRVEMTIGGHMHDVYVSQENAGGFKRWIMSV